MASNKKYWKSVEELDNNNQVIKTLKENEFVEEIPTDKFLGDEHTFNNSSTSRRDFLKYIGFSTAAASLAACEGPVNKTIPYVIQPEQLRPGVPDYYATTIADGFDFAHVLVKTREGRPIGIEKNTDAKYRNIPNARAIASILELYDNIRVQSPSSKGVPISWNDLDSQVINQIKSTKSVGKRVVLLTNTIPSPSTSVIISDFSEKFGGIDHVIYDSIPYDSILNAFEQKYGKRAIPDYDLSKASFIISFGADFLGDWQGGGFDDKYAQGRIPTDGRMSHHIQLESNMTLSGANADKRIALKSSEIEKAFSEFYAQVMGLSIPQTGLSKEVSKVIKNAAKTFLAAGNKAVVLLDSPYTEGQLLAFALNEQVASEAFDYTNPLFVRQGDTSAVTQLVKDMKAGKVGVLITDGVNPIYTMPDTMEFDKAMEKVPFSVVFSQKIDETASQATYVAAASHNLESWGDVELKSNYYGLIQPTIRPLFNTRQLQESLLKWSGYSKGYYEYLHSFWIENILEDYHWDKALSDGFFEKKNTKTTNSKSIDYAAYFSNYQQLISSSTDYELVLYTKTGMGDGRQANNPWLQEFPDPITRASWDNYATISQIDAKKLGLKNIHVANGALDGSYAKLTLGSTTLKVPVIIQPGQAVGTVGLALGYGRRIGLKEEMQTGINAFRFYTGFKKNQNIKISSTIDMHEFACVQLHNTLMGRGDIIKETTLNTFLEKPKEVWNEKPKVSLDHKEVNASSVSLWEDFDRSIGHHFNLSIDLNACTGCGTCVIACHAENNVPVVGKQEVRRSRDMHWLRIDRYYSSDDTFLEDDEKKENIFGLSDSMSEFGKLENASTNPQVAFQPIMCQHCNHAPCETVCPVAATSHGRQGQNQMAYNRCVGTRYCANNCPYKVRRFNWFLYNNNDEFDYYMNDDLGKMVLNPDVVVRSRGVMEKCSLCIQKTQHTILTAKREGREVKDGEFQTACSIACGTGALIFGDLNDLESKVSSLREKDRAYHLLEHIGTKPNVFYHVKVRNTEEA